MSLSVGGGPGGGTRRAGHPVWVEQPSVAGGEGQQRTAPAGRHVWSISNKQGKLIPGPSALLMGVSTTLQLEPGAAVQGLAVREGGSAQRRRWRGNRQGCLAPKEREVGAQAGELAQPGGKGQQPCPGGGQQSLRAQPPLAGGAPWDTQRLSCPQG